jgi:uncharacterized repeat protein (TIGR02543 family)
MKKKFLSVALAAGIMFSSLTGTAFAANYSDTTGHWASAAIDQWSNVGVVQGIGDNKFNPGGNMTRAEAAQVLVNLLQLPDATKIVSGYTDMVPGAWYENAISRCVEEGILNGISETQMNPNGAVTREQFFVMFARALSISSESTINKTFADANQISSYASGAINALVNHGYVNGLTTSQLGPKNNIDRASVASLLAQTCVGYVTSDGTVTAEKAGIVIDLTANVTVTGSADVTVVAAKEGAKVDFSSYTGTATVIALENNAAVTNAPGGTTVLAAAGTTGVTANGLDVAAGSSSSIASAFIPTQPTVTTGGSSGGSNTTRYTLSFVTNDGTAIDNASIASGTTVNLATYTTTRDGYTFGGWYTNEDLTGRVDSITVTQNTTLYARWVSDTETYTITAESTVSKDEGSDTVYNNVTIADSVGDGEVTLEGLTIKGDLTIAGGGSNSIHLKNCDIQGNIIMKKSGGEAPRLVLDQTPVKNNLVAETPAIIEAIDSETSEIANVIAKDNITVKGDDTKVKNVSVQAESAEKTVALKLEGSTIEAVTAETKVAVSGEGGTVAKVEAKADVAISGAKVTEVQASNDNGVALTLSAGASVATVKADKPVTVAGDANTKVDNVVAKANVEISGAAVEAVSVETEVAQGEEEAQAVTLTLKAGAAVAKVDAVQPVAVSGEAGTTVAEVVAKNDVEIKGATVEAVTVDESNVELKLSEGASVATVKADKSVTVSGTGATVGTVEANAAVTVDSTVVSKVTVPATASNVEVTVSGSNAVAVENNAPSTTVKIPEDSAVAIDVSGSANTNVVNDSEETKITTANEALVTTSNESKVAESKVTVHVHSWSDGVVTKAATCTTSGVLTKECQNGGCNLQTMTETIPATGHNFSTEWTIDKYPTCSETGIQSKHCTNEGCTAKTDVTVIAKDPTKHNFGSDGKCQDCGSAYTYVPVKVTGTYDDGKESGTPAVKYTVKLPGDAVYVGMTSATVTVTSNGEAKTNTYSTGLTGSNVLLADSTAYAVSNIYAFTGSTANVTVNGSSFGTVTFKSSAADTVNKTITIKAAANSRSSVTSLGNVQIGNTGDFKIATGSYIVTGGQRFDVTGDITNLSNVRAFADNTGSGVAASSSGIQVVLNTGSVITLGGYTLTLTAPTTITYNVNVDLSGLFDASKSDAQLAQAWGEAINALLGAINGRDLTVVVRY